MAYRDIEARRAYGRLWYAQNRKKLQEESLARYHERREEINESRRTRRAEEESFREMQVKATREWRHKNVAHCREYDRQRHKKDVIKRRAQAKKWAINNPQAHKTFGARKRARKRNAKGNHTIKQWVARIEFYGWRCAYCRTLLNQKTVTQDHQIPISRGGSNWASNLVPACLGCNNRKHNRKPTEWMTIRRTLIRPLPV